MISQEEDNDEQGSTAGSLGMVTAPSSPTTPSPRRRRTGRGQGQQPNQQQAAATAPSSTVAAAVVPNSPQRQPRSLRAASLPFRLRLFVTGAFTPRSGDGSGGVDKGLLSVDALPAATGRPCVPGVLDAWAREGAERELVGLVVCGPEGLGVEARHWAVRKGVDLHEEVFHW